AFSVIPFGKGWKIWHWHVNGAVANVPISVILIFALGSLGIYGFIIGGWASESKYSLLGAMRTCAQMVSYEVSLALSVLGVVLMAHSLNVTDIVNAQLRTWWYAAPQLVGLIWFFIKLLLAVSVFIWLRATLPRLRYDQLMRFGWKILLPVATINAVITALFVVIF